MCVIINVNNKTTKEGGVIDKIFANDRHFNLKYWRDPPVDSLCDIKRIHFDMTEVCTANRRQLGISIRFVMFVTTIILRMLAIEKMSVKVDLYMKLRYISKC